MSYSKRRNFKMKRKFLKAAEEKKTHGLQRGKDKNDHRLNCEKKKKRMSLKC